MSRSKRDIRAHIARNPRKYFPDEPLRSRDTIDRDILFEKGIVPTKNYPEIAWSIQGKRRRCSTRKGNQKVKRMVHQIQRAKEKMETKEMVKKAFL